MGSRGVSARCPRPVIARLLDQYRHEGLRLFAQIACQGAQILFPAFDCGAAHVLAISLPLESLYLQCFHKKRTLNNSKNMAHACLANAAPNCLLNPRCRRQTLRMGCCNGLSADHVIGTWQLPGDHPNISVAGNRYSVQAEMAMA